MSSIKEVKKMMDFDENTHMCDISDISEDSVHLESWDEDVSREEFDKIAELIAADGYDITGFSLLEIPHPRVFCFGNNETDQYFDIIKEKDGEWKISALVFSEEKGYYNVPAGSIKEAIVKSASAIEQISQLPHPCGK